MVNQLKTKSDFTSALQSAGSKLVVVDFYADWCGPCKFIAPKIEELSKELTDVAFFKVNVDENEETAQDEGIQAMPTFILYKNGKKVTEVVGADIGKLTSAINSNK